jgi:cytochrome c oxidase subunit 3
MTIAVANTLTAKEEQREKMTSSIAMIMTLVSFSMLFATLMMGYIAYRFTSTVWPPLGMQRAGLELPTISTVIILLSSLTYFLTERANEEGNLKALKRNFLLTLILGTLFMVSQLFLWSDLKGNGIYVDTTVFASIIYAFTWVHAAHVIGGLIALLLLIPSVLGKRNKLRNQIWFNNVGQFWHFLGIVWAIIYFSIFVF